MMRRLMICLCLLAVACAAPAGTEAAAKQARSRARAPAPARAVAAKAKQDSAATRARMVAAPRRLEDIHIEGEIPAPQVLFVTARDQRRFTRFNHQRYLKTSVQVGESTPLPTRVALTSPPPTPAGAP